jgi:hypothetical protein
MDEARKALLALYESGELVNYSPDGDMLRDAYSRSTDWGSKLTNDDEWHELACTIQQTNLLRLSDERAAYEAMEEDDLKARLGGYYPSACGAVANDAPLADVHCGGWNAVMEEIESRLQRTLPSIGEVRRRLGDDSAEQYRCGIESLEERGWTLTVARDAPSPRMLNGTCISIVRPTRRVGRAQELRDIASLVEMASLPEPSDTVEAYVRMIERKKRFRKERRVELKQRNKSALRTARSFGFWFCYAKDASKWLNDPATAEMAPAFLALVKAARAQLAPQRCVMQYIPKRRLTKRAARELLGNMAMLVKFLDPNVKRVRAPKRDSSCAKRPRIAKQEKKRG